MLVSFRPRWLQWEQTWPVKLQLETDWDRVLRTSVSHLNASLLPENLMMEGSIQGRSATTASEVSECEVQNFRPHDQMNSQAAVQGRRLIVIQSRVEKVMLAAGLT